MDGASVLERLRALPGGAELLDSAREYGAEVELVGGAVRDIVLGASPRELDVVVDGDARMFAEVLARRVGGSASVANGVPPARAGDLGDLGPGDRGEMVPLGGGKDTAFVAGGGGLERGVPPARAGGLGAELTYHERFRTALVRWPEGEIDVAMRRGETYRAPGALPQVAPGDAQQDLERRDFTVNAIAVALAGEREGRLRAVEGALDDLDARRLRVLHDASFRDDPTRILRAARYRARLGFEIEPHTAGLLEQALVGGALQTLSGERLGAELRLALAEADPVAPLAEMERLGVLRAWQPGVSFDETLARTALAELAQDGTPRVMLVASLLLDLCNQLDHEDVEPEMRGFLEDVQLPAREGRLAFSVAINAMFIVDHVDSVETTSDLLELMGGAPVEALALAAAMCELENGPDCYGKLTIDDWVERQRHIEPQLTGDDLLAAGVPEGPEVGARLEECYRLLLEGQIEPGRDSELRAALKARVRR